MKFKKLIGKITAFVLAGTMMLGNVPVYADTAANSGADVFATQGSDFTIRIPKQLVLSGDEGTGAYRVAVKGNISGTDIITVTPDADFYMKQEGKSDILATITQPKTNFTYADGVRPETEVTSDGVIEMASISAGKWSGLFNFTVTSSVDLSLEDSIGSDKADINGSVIGDDVSQDKHSEYDSIVSGTTNNVPSETPTPITVTATNSNGENLNASAYTIVGKEAKDLLDKLNESGLIEDTKEVDALIEVESDDFEGIADTTFDVSSIANPGDTVVILHFDEEKQMWEHIGTETVDENGKVNGDFTSYSPVAFVKVNPDGSYEIPLTAGLYDKNGDITYTWNELISNKLITVNGTNIKDVNETITGKLIIDNSITSIGYQSFYNSSLTSMVIPNSITSIEMQALRNCTKLSKIYYIGTKKDWESIYLGSQWNHNSPELTFVQLENYNNLDKHYHNYIEGICETCGKTGEYSIPGLYDENENITYTWDELISNKLITVSGTNIKDVNESITGKLVINNSITSIGGQAFYNSSLTSIVMPNTITSIEMQAFRDCQKLSIIYFIGTEEECLNISKGSQWNYNCPAVFCLYYKHY